MKNQILATALLSLLFIVPCLGQDTLSQANMASLTRVFLVEHGKLTGPGADFILDECAAANYVMLGEYHGSKRISEFTEALIPELDKVGFKNLILEIGPISARQLRMEGGSLHESLRDLFDRYHMEHDGDKNEPIPFVANVEDVNFLEAARSRNWEFAGIDQEYFFGYPMLMDQMYENLPDEKQSILEELYARARDSILQFYKIDFNDGKHLSVSVKHSPLMNQFLYEMSTSSSNEPIIDAFNKSIDIYYLYATRQWYENNGTRIAYMKSNLNKALSEMNFDKDEDKLLIKMGSYHLSKGFSPLGFYEVGNTLNEMAAFHGTKCLNIGFSMRYYLDGDQIVDALDDKRPFRQRYRGLNQMGRENEWVVIDLRPMIKGIYYYPVKYDVNEYVEDYIKRYDLLIIPRYDEDPTLNTSMK